MTRRRVLAGAALLLISAGALVLTRPLGQPPRSEPLASLMTPSPAPAEPKAKPAGIGIDPAAGRVVCRDPAGNPQWATPLAGDLGGARRPHVQADTARVYVTHGDGVTALDAHTGDVLWHSPGPADRLLVSGSLLLAADCSGGDHIATAGRWMTARDTATGGEVFRVALPAEEFDANAIQEVGGLLLVQKMDDPWGRGLALLIDRAGRVRHRFDRLVVAARAWAGGHLVLTSRDVVRLSAAGAAAWSAPFRQPEWIAGGGLVPLPGGDVAAFLYGRIHDGGVQVVRLDPETGAQRWSAGCAGLGVRHSAYRHRAAVDLRDDLLRVTSWGDGGTFVEVLDAGSGVAVGRKVFDRDGR